VLPRRSGFDRLRRNLQGMIKELHVGSYRDSNMELSS
jgi:hypothetical protein